MIYKLNNMNIWNKYVYSYKDILLMNNINEYKIINEK